MAEDDEKDKKTGKLEKTLRNSPINYFSDLFIVAIVVGWIGAAVIMNIAAIYSMIVLADTSVWSYAGELVSTPVAAGAGMWMVKNSVQHAIHNYKGEECPMDFAKVETEGELQAEEAVEFCEKDNSEKGGELG